MSGKHNIKHNANRGKQNKDADTKIVREAILAKKKWRKYIKYEKNVGKSEREKRRRRRKKKKIL